MSAAAVSLLESKRQTLTQGLLPGVVTCFPRNNGAVFKDPAFAENKQLPIHRWVPWIAGFSAAFVDDILEAHLPAHGKAAKRLVLDPFSGVGTTLVQASLRGHDAVGFEINPYAALAARVKLAAPRLDLTHVDRALEALRREASGWHTGPSPATARPPHFCSRIPFFSPRVERQVLHVFDFIGRLRPPAVADLFRVAFGAVMVSFSNYTYEPSLGSRPGAGKPLIENADVADVLLAKLLQMHSDIRWVQEETDSGERAGSGEVHNTDFFEGQSIIRAGTVSLMVTSPPYLNNYHYVRNTRPQLHWLSLLGSPAQQRNLEEQNFGKFWQTVREREAVDLAFEHRGLSRLLADLRRVRVEAGAYGGPGWANYAATYFNDCDRFLGCLGRLLTRGGLGLIVMGNSIVQGLEIKVDEILGDLASRHGLRTEGIHRNRTKRVGASITQSTLRRGEANQSMLYESTVVIRKP